MNAFELKGGLYDMIAQVNDKELLTEIHGLIAKLIDQNVEKTDFWDELDEQQHAELDLAIEESYNEKNLVDHETAVKQIKGWLKKG